MSNPEKWRCLYGNGDHSAPPKIDVTTQVNDPARRAAGNSRVSDKVRPDVPHSARIWNYWMGGKDNYEVDRVAGDKWIRVDPGIVALAKQSRQFLIRVVRYLAAQAGMRQFLDIGTGLPTTMQNTHEVAQAVVPDAKVVYVDNDPLVLAHARALLTTTTPEGSTAQGMRQFLDIGTVARRRAPNPSTGSLEESLNSPIDLPGPSRSAGGVIAGGGTAVADELITLIAARCLADHETAQRYRDAVTRPAGPAAAERRAWTITACDRGEVRA